MVLIDDLIANKTIFFNYMKEKYEVHSKSNIFLRDIIYALQSYYQKKGTKIKYSEAEKLTFDFTSQLVKKEELIPMGKNTWKVNFSLDNSVTKISEQKNKLIYPIGNRYEQSY